MAGNIANSTRSQHSEFSTSRPGIRAQPHKVPSFWRLFGLFNRQTRPLNFDAGFADTEGDYFSSHHDIARGLSLGADRVRRYDIFDEMDNFGLVQAILDVYAEEATQPDYDKGKRVWVESKANHMIQAGEECLSNCMVEDKVWAVTRRMCKYGDAFQRLLYSSGRGVVGWKFAKQHQMDRVEDRFGRLVGFKEAGQKYRKALHSDGADTSFPWDYLHFRLLGKHEEDGYGTGLTEGFFREWRQLCVAQGTLIWTDEGPVPVEDLEDGATVYCHDPVTKQTAATSAVRVWEQGVRDLVTIRTYHRSITVTPDHGMLIKDREGNFRYKRAGELVADGGENGDKYADCLVLPRLDGRAATYSVTLESAKYTVWLDEPMTTPAGVMSRIDDAHLTTSRKNAHAFLRGQRGIRYDDYRKLRGVLDIPSCHVRYKKGSIPCRFIDAEDLGVTFDLGFARLFGFMLGDRWLNADCRTGVGFALGVDERVNQAYVELAADVFDGAARPTFTKDAPGRGVSVYFNSEAIRDTFRAAGFVSGFASKHVPAWVFGMSRDFKRELIYGLLDADGGRQASGWRLSLSNRTLIEQVVMLCQQSGFRVSAEIAELDRTNEEKSIRSTCPSYRVWINDEPDDEAVVYEPVVRVARAGRGLTFDVQIEDELHNFVANGVVSHNTLAEDSMLMYRLRRAPDRNLVLVDVGTLEDHEAARYTNQFRKRMRKYELIDPSTPEYKKQYNPLTPLEDVFLPIRADTNTRIETLSGSGNVGEIYDIEHMRDAFFGAARVPKAYFGFEGEINAKATLQQQDVRFARGIKRVQRADIFGIRQLLDVHYTLLRASEGGDEKFDFRAAANQYLVQMSPIAYLDEFERIELIQMRYQLVETMGNLAGAMQLDPRAWQAYILINFAKLPEEMVMRLLQTVPPATANGSEGKIVGRGEGWDKLDERQRTHVLYEEYIAKGRVAGFYELNEDEKLWIGRAIHSSPGLRKSVSTFAELAEEEQREAALQQTDPSLLPVIVPGGVLNDNYNDGNAAVRALNEDLAVLRDPSKLRQRVVEVQHNRRVALAAAASSRQTPLVEATP